MNGRVRLATGLGFREQLRRPLLVVLLVVVPVLFISRAIAITELTPRTVGVPGGGEVVTTLRDIHGAMMAAITVAFLAGLCGAFVMRSARQADRRLVVAGFRPIEAVLPRLAMLGAATLLVVVVSLFVTGLSYTPRSWSAFAAGTLLVGLIYGCLGSLAGALFGQVGATYVVLFMATLGMGILQNPMFGDGTPGGLAVVLPEYGPGRVVVDAGFAEGFHAWGELGIGVAWVVALAAILALVLRRSLRPR